MPGTVKNVQVQLAQNGQINVFGDDVLDVVGIPVTKHFKLTLQPYISSCQLKVHVIHADLSGIPVTGFVANFENQINQQLVVNLSKLPGGFTYCATSVHTAVQNLVVTYSAHPIHS